TYTSTNAAAFAGAGTFTVAAQTATNPSYTSKGNYLLPAPTADVNVTVQYDYTPTLVISDVTLAEGNAGSTAFNFTVTLSTASTSTVTVAYSTADGTATAGSDYSAAGGTLFFAPGETSKTVTINVTGDTNVEGNETFFVNLSSP